MRAGAGETRVRVKGEGVVYSHEQLDAEMVRGWALRACSTRHEVRADLGGCEGLERVWCSNNN